MDEKLTLESTEESKVSHSNESKDGTANSSNTAKTDSSQTTTEEVAQSLIELSTLPRLEKSPDGEHGNTEKVMSVDERSCDNIGVDSSKKSAVDLKENRQVASSTDHVELLISLQEIANYMSSVTLSPTLRGEIAKLIPSLIKECPQESHSGRKN